MNVETDKISKEQYQELIDEMYSWACSNGEYEWYAMDSDGTIIGYNDEEPYMARTCWEPNASDYCEVLGCSEKTELYKFWKHSLIHLS